MTRSLAFPAASGSPNASLRTSAWSRRLGRLRRWEFWPAWAVYAPLLPALAWYALRFRGSTVFTAANPGMPGGGLVGESKWDILRTLPRDSIVPSMLIPPGAPGARRRSLMESESVGPYPIILKPDVGERGVGLCLARSRDHALDYLARQPGAVIVQRYHEGPFEAGVFYARRPGAAQGHIFSITDKIFPRVTGDARTSLRDLILSHPRLCLQAPVFLERLGPLADRIPLAGESVPLAVAGNHCQGTMFLDGASLITPELTRAFDRIALATSGFFFGRFDVRYACTQAFRRGEDFQIVELNGVGSESTNIYDLPMPFWRAQRILRAQWRLAFEIGAANRRLGTPVTPPLALLRTALAHIRRSPGEPRAD